MKNLKTFLTMMLLAMLGGLAFAAAPDEAERDWADTLRYRADNATLGSAKPGERRVVFMGDSITDAWPLVAPALFASKAWIGRGISGQTTPQMLVRFRADVLALEPAAVVILAGTNDVAGNTGPATVEQIESNIASMAELARAHGIRVIVASVLPASRYYWNPALEPAAKIAALNDALRRLARREGHVYLDCYTPMVDAEGGLPKQYSDDGVHPNARGYELMRSLVEPAIKEVLAQR